MIYLKIKNFLEGKETYSRSSVKVIIALLFLLPFLYLVKDAINMPTSTSIIIAVVMLFIIIFNTAIIYPPKNNLQKILQDIVLVLIFLIIALFLIFWISALHMANLIGIESKITYTSIGSGLIAIFGLLFIYQRLEKQQKQIDIQINQRVDDRFNSAINLLGSSETSARTGAIYALHELAIEEEKYRRQIAQIMCSHIRSKTNELEYQKNHGIRPKIDSLLEPENNQIGRPSNEIQTTIDLLFKFKEKGLYTQDFARVDEFPKANLSCAYLMGVDFTNAQCQGVNFDYAQCQRTFFISAQCQDANFFMAQCQDASFRMAQCQGASFRMAQCQGANFTNAQCQGVDFSKAECQGVGLRSAECQGANFSKAQFDQPLDIQTGGEINDRAIKAIEDARPYLSNSWYEEMQKIIKENKGKDPEFRTFT